MTAARQKRKRSYAGCVAAAGVLLLASAGLRLANGRDHRTDCGGLAQRACFWRLARSLSSPRTGPCPTAPISSSAIPGQSGGSTIWAIAPPLRRSRKSTCRNSAATTRWAWSAASRSPAIPSLAHRRASALSVLRSHPDGKVRRCADCLAAEAECK